MKPRFSVKRLLIAMTLIAIGTAMVPLVPQYERSGGPFAVCLLLWFGGGGLVGAGLFTPFKSTWLGALLGFMAMVAMLFLINMDVIGW